MKAFDFLYVRLDTPRSAERDGAKPCALLNSLVAHSSDISHLAIDVLEIKHTKMYVRFWLVYVTRLRLHVSQSFSLITEIIFPSQIAGWREVEDALLVPVCALDM